jgi:hypothetical protein
MILKNTCKGKRNVKEKYIIYITIKRCIYYYSAVVVNGDEDGLLTVVMQDD